MSLGDKRSIDAQAIEEVLLGYATGIDRRDWELFRRCFTEDVDADYGEAVGHFKGIDELTAFMEEQHADMGITMHSLTNHVVDVDGDRATARTYVDAVLMDAEGVSGVNPVGYYDDELVRTGDGWRIAKRSVTIATYRIIG